MTQTPEWLMRGAPERADLSLPQVISRHFCLILIMMLLAAPAAALYLHYATPLYTSTAKLFIQPNSPRVMGGPDNGGYNDASVYFINNEKAVLLSTPVLADVAKQPELRSFKLLSKVPNIVEFLKKEVDVVAGRKEDTLTLSLDAPDPREAMILIQAMVQSYIAHQAQEKRTTTTELLNVVQQESQDCDRQIAKTSAAMLALKKAGGIPSYDSRTMATGTDTQQKLKEAVLAANYDASTAEAAFREATDAWPTDPKHEAMLQEAERAGTIIISSDAEAATLRRGLLEMQQKVDDAKRISGENHPQVKAMQGQLEDRRAAYLVAARRRWNAAQDRRISLQAALEEQQQATSTLAEKFSGLETLSAEMERLEKRSDSLTTRIRELRAEQVAGSLNIKLLEPASLEDRPSKPNIPRTYLIAVLGGLLLGITGGYWRERTRPPARSPEEILATLGISVVDLLPRIAEAKGEVTREQRVFSDPAAQGNNGGPGMHVDKA